MKTVDQLVEGAKHLPLDQRLTLAHRVLITCEAPVSDEIKREWDAVIRERINRYDQGHAHSRPASEVFADLDHKLRS